MSTGDIHGFGTLHVNSEKLKKPIPEYSSYSDEYKYSTYEYKSYFGISNTTTDTDYTLNWVEVINENKTFFICDRNLLIDISYDDLDRLGYINGKEIEIDGVLYIIRSLIGNGNYNEWDLYICNSINNKKLPFINNEDDVFNHNKFWNWNGIYSICIGNYYNNDYLSLLRGCKEYNSYYLYSTSIRNNDVGWRPVLEKISDNYDILNKNSTFTQIYNSFSDIEYKLSNEINKLKCILLSKGINCDEDTTLSELINKVEEL